MGVRAKTRSGREHKLEEAGPGAQDVVCENELHFSFATAAPPPDSAYYGTQERVQRFQEPRHRMC